MLAPSSLALPRYFTGRYHVYYRIADRGHQPAASAIARRGGVSAYGHPLFVGRPKSIKALEKAMESDKQILLLAQKSASKDEPSADDLYALGTVATVLQLLKLPDGTVKVLVEGRQRASVNHINEDAGYFVGDITPLPAEGKENTETEAMRRALIGQFEQFVKLNKKIPPEILSSLSAIDKAGRLADTIAAQLPLKLEQSRMCWKWPTSKPGWSTCWPSWNQKSTSCRWKSASVAGQTAMEKPARLLPE